MLGFTNRPALQEHSHAEFSIFTSIFLSLSYAGFLKSIGEAVARISAAALRSVR